MFIQLPARAKNISGKRFSRLVASGPVSRRKNGHTVYLCICDCGNEKFVTCSNLKSGHTTSCGCFMREAISMANSTHGRSSTRLYGVWSQMKQRCELTTAPNYKWYGAKGVRVCDRWRDSFEAFVEDMGEPPRGYEIDRIDGRGNYEPGNCRWVSKLVNLNNRAWRPAKLKEDTQHEIR